MCDSSGNKFHSKPLRSFVLLAMHSPFQENSVTDFDYYSEIQPKVECFATYIAYIYLQGTL